MAASGCELKLSHIVFNSWETFRCTLEGTEGSLSGRLGLKQAVKGYRQRTYNVNLLDITGFVQSSDASVVLPGRYFALSVTH